ncbi:MAG: arylesterase [Microvirga sp.]|nr:arylesterase [Microvirga sp.]
MSRQPGPFRRLVFLALALAAVGASRSGDVARADEALTIVALGDSLTAGYGLPASDSFPNQLEAALRQRGHHVNVINAGVSGDTASGGRDRLDWSVPDEADGVIVALGANDMLRGLDPGITEQALETIVARLRDRGLGVLLAGMMAGRNLGPQYVERFDGIYPALAARHGVGLYPFFLDGVAGEAALNLDDGIHPNAEGVAIMVERMLPTVEAFIASLSAS